MSRSMKSFLQVLIAFVFMFGAFGTVPVRPVEAASVNVVISEVYGGGGNSGATYKNDFIELFNLGIAAVDLTGWSVQYASSTGSSWQVTLLSGTIQPGAYYLIQEAAGAGTQPLLPTPDATGTIPMSGTTGKVALVNDSTALTGTGNPMPVTVVDFVGYGSANAYETAPTPALTNSTSAARTNVCTDSDNNSVDFSTGAPAPQNSASPAHTCVALVSVAPSDGSTGVSISAPITVTFNQAVSPAAGTFNLSEGINTIAATVSTTDNTVFTIQPDAPLAYLTSYTLTITGSALTPPMTNPAVATYTFTTIANPITPAQVTSISIPGDLSWMDPSPTITVTFDKEVTPGSGWYSMICDSVDVSANISTLDTQGLTFNFTTSTPFAHSAQCTFTVIGANVETGTLDQSKTFTVRANDDTAPVFVSSNPASNAILHASPAKIQLTFSEAVNIDTDLVTLVCSNSAPSYALVATADAAIWELTPATAFASQQTCTLTIPGAAVTDNDVLDPPDLMTTNVQINLAFGEFCADPFTTIMAIQGSGTTSPMANLTLSTMGVVTGNYEAGKKGFYIQDPVGDGNLATSDGLFIFSNNVPTGLQPGQLVRVRGKAVEYNGMTEISPLDWAFSCGTGAAITPVELTMPIGVFDLETVESMLVHYTQPLVINEYYQYDQYGEITLSSKRLDTPTNVVAPGATAIALQAANDLDKIVLDDGSNASNPAYLRHPDGGRYCQGTLLATAPTDCPAVHIFRGGDHVSNLTAVMDYYSNTAGTSKYWRLEPVGLATFESVNPRTPAPELVAGELRISSINTLNYFITLNNSTVGSICGPLGNQGCRGAVNEEERLRQRAKTVAAVTGMASDVTGLLELENDNPTTTSTLGADYAIASIVAGLNEAAGSVTYAYIPTGVIGGDAIKAGIVYKPAKVTPVGSYALLTTLTDPEFIDTCNRPVLAQTFQDLATGQMFTLAVNHLKSKSSACAALNDIDTGDGQGAANLTRTKAAAAEVRWLETDPTNTGSNMYLIMGDLNSYAKEDPITALKNGADGVPGSADDYFDLVQRFRELFGYPQSYGYVFGAQAGYLDGALANKRMASYVLDAKEWHINSDEVDAIDYTFATYKKADQKALYQPDAYRSSDHDPILVSLMLNHDPAPADDAYTAYQNRVLAVDAANGVLANDIDANIYDKISASILTQPANGLVVMQLDGSFTYTPNPNFVGVDTFQYTMHADPGLMSAYANTATVTITVEYKSFELYLPLINK